jgi:hypothetical protein
MTKRIAPTRPYQPFLLRVLHSLTGLFLIAAIQPMTAMIALEITILVSIVAAWIIPLFK